MITKIFKILLFFIVLVSTAYGQDIKNENESLITDQDKFIAISQVDNFLLNSNVANQSALQSGVNSVFIQQIGSDNFIFSNIVSESSNINIVQKGNQNSVEIDETALQIEKMITQTGNNNSVIDFSFNPDVSTNLELIQEGNNLTFERFGSNELSNNLRFRMSGEARTIIVRSF